jgi:MFS family permease
MANQGTAEGGGRGLLASVPRSVLLLIVVMAVNGFAFSYLIIYVAAYLPQVGVPAPTVGLVLGAEGLSMAVFAIPFGLLSDRRGRKRLLVLGSLGAAPLFFVFAVTTDAAAMVAAAVLGGVCEGTYLATVNATIADQTAPKNRDSAFTLSFIVGGAGGSLGTALPFFVPAMSGLLGMKSSALHSGLLFLLGFFSLVLSLALYVILRNVPETIRARGVSWTGKSTRTLLKFSGINSLIGLGAGFIIPLIPTWLFLKFAVPDTYSGPLLAVAGTTIGLAAIFSPRIAARIGSVRAVVLTQGLSLVFMVALAFEGNVLAAAAIYVVRTMLMNMSQPLLDSYLMGIVVPEQRGFASSVNSVIWRVPNSITTIAGGVILASGNFVLPFILAGAFYACSISLFYPTFRNVKPLG